MKADATLDCLGLYCPMPIVNTAAKIKELQPGQVLEVVSDDRGIKSDMAAWCQSTGHELLSLDEKGREIRVYVRKKS